MLYTRPEREHWGQRALGSCPSSVVCQLCDSGQITNLAWPHFSLVKRGWGCRWGGGEGKGGRGVKTQGPGKPSGAGGWYVFVPRDAEPVKGRDQLPAWARSLASSLCVLCWSALSGDTDSMDAGGVSNLSAWRLAQDRPQQC